MKKGLVSKLGATALVLSLVTASLVGGTFAKYTKTASSEAMVTVAGFDFTATANLDFGIISPDGKSNTATLTITPNSDVDMEIVISTAQLNLPDWASITVSGGGLTNEQLTTTLPAIQVLKSAKGTPIDLTFTCTAKNDLITVDDNNPAIGGVLETSLTITGTQTEPTT